MPNVHANTIRAMFKNNEIKTKNLYDPFTNSYVGANILTHCLNRFHGNQSKALLCYNGSLGDPDKEYVVLVTEALKKVNKAVVI